MEIVVDHRTRIRLAWVAAVAGLGLMIVGVDQGFYLLAIGPIGYVLWHGMGQSREPTILTLTFTTVLRLALAVGVGVAVWSVMSLILDGEADPADGLGLVLFVLVLMPMMVGTRTGGASRS